MTQKRMRRWFLLVVAGLLPMPALAGTSYFHVPPEAFQLAGGDSTKCYLTTTANASFQNASPPGNYEWVMGDPADMGTNCIIKATVFMPTSALNGALQQTVFEADGSATSNKYCYKNHFEFANTAQNAGSTVAGWAYLTGGQCSSNTLTTGVSSVVGRNSAFADQAIYSGAAIPGIAASCLVSGPSTATACTGTTCNGMKGNYFVERCQCGVDANCLTGTDAGGNSLFEGASVGYTTP